MTFMGRHITKVDQGKRLSVPTRYKENLGSPFVITLSGDKPCVQCYSVEEFDKKYQETRDRIGDLIDEDDILMDLFGDTTDVSPDSKGRITITDEHADILQLSEEAVFVGMGNHVEIWNVNTFNEYKLRSRQSVQKVKDADKLVREANIAKRISDAKALMKTTEGDSNGV